MRCFYFELQIYQITHFAIFFLHCCLMIQVVFDNIHLEPIRRYLKFNSDWKKLKIIFIYYNNKINNYCKTVIF
jgi:hypothetical protein